MRSISPRFSLGLGGILFVADRLFKYAAVQTVAAQTVHSPSFGWSPFLNPGVAFGIPLPQTVVILFSVPIIGLLLYLAAKQLPSAARSDQNNLPFPALILIIAGALSNLIDRLLYAHTVDYWQMYTAVINLADIQIAGGFMLYFWQLHAKNSSSSTKNHL